MGYGRPGLAACVTPMDAGGEVLARLFFGLWVGEEAVDWMVMVV